MAFPGPWIHPWAQPHPHFHGLIPGDKSSFSQGRDGSGSTLRAGFGGSQSSQNPHRPRWDFSSRQDKLGSNPAATKGKDKKQSPFLPPFPAAKIKKKIPIKVTLCPPRNKNEPVLNHSSLLTENNQNLIFPPKGKVWNGQERLECLEKQEKKRIFPIFLSTKLIQELILGEVFPSAPLFHGKVEKFLGSSCSAPSQAQVHNSWIPTWNSQISLGAGEGDQLPKIEWKKGRKIPEGSSGWGKRLGKAMKWWEKPWNDGKPPWNGLEGA